MPEKDQAEKLLGARFEQAVELAFRLHGRQTRKGSQIPYIAHLLGVAALVIEDGGSEYEAIAALLHDGPEDQGGEETLADIRAKFGEQVARIVANCSDTFEAPKPPWKERKLKHLKKIKDVEADTCRVLLADKLYNARALVSDLHREGETTWEKFNGGKDGTLWYYREMHALLSEKLPGELADMLGRVIKEIEQLSH
ncbi:MAG: HD domain-containing protein [Chloroflexota bacterium]